MIPTTVGGVLTFVASIGPGYLFVRLAERRRPRRKGSALEQAAEMLVVGSVATVLAVLLVLAVGESVGLLDASKLGSTDDYVLERPLRALGGVAAVLGISYGLSWMLVARLVPDTGANLTSVSVYHKVTHEDRGAGRGIFATVELRDGRRVTGALRHFDFDSDTREGDIALVALPGRKLLVRQPSGAALELAEDFVIVRLSDVVYMSGRYGALLDEPPASPPPTTSDHRTLPRPESVAKRRAHRARPNS